MTFRLSGRLQTRVLAMGVVGGLWALLFTPVLPRPVWQGGRVGLGAMYAMTLRALAVVIAVGLAWELVYHGLQQFRWDKDWPAPFALATVVNEGVCAWLVLHWLGVIPGPLTVSSPFVPAYCLFLASTWVLVWLFLQGPIRVAAVRWRYRGGRFF